MNYEFFTDTCANLTDDIIERYNIHILPFSFIIDGGAPEKSYYKGEKSDLQKYYKMLRDGKRITTSCVNEDEFVKAFEPVLQQGKDVLFLGFSSALSASHSQAIAAQATLAKKYPQRKIVVIDSLSASLGEGLLAYHVVQRIESGMTLDEITKWIYDNIQHMIHLFTVDNLVYLLRGGRINKASCIIGNLVQLKPIMYVDALGRLVPYGKVIGRKKSLISLADKMADTIINPSEQTIFISHGDCIDDVNFFIDKLAERITVKNIVINYVDPVVGAHCGPGTFAVFYLGIAREYIPQNVNVAQAKALATATIAK